MAGPGAGEVSISFGLTRENPMSEDYLPKCSGISSLKLPGSCGFENLFVKVAPRLLPGRIDIPTPMCAPWEISPQLLRFLQRFLMSNRLIIS
jgi:hypothetical protein